jgi:hypothetical protein
VDLPKQDVVDLDNQSGEAARQPSFGRKTMEGFFMITRRGFLRVLAAGAGLAAVKLSFAARLERYLAEHNAPLLEAPEHPSLIITACRDMGSLHIGDPYEGAPFKTWREYLEDQGEIVPGERIDFRRLGRRSRHLAARDRYRVPVRLLDRALKAPTLSRTSISNVLTSAPSSRAAAPRRDTSISSTGRVRATTTSASSSAAIGR